MYARSGLTKRDLFLDCNNVGMTTNTIEDEFGEFAVAVTLTGKGFAAAGLLKDATPVV